MKKIIPIILALMILAPMVLADDLTVLDSQMTVKIYNTSSWVNDTLEITLEIINGDYAGNNINKTLTNFNITSGTYSIDFPFVLAQDTTINLSTIDLYTTCNTEKEKCIADKVSFERAWQFCQNDLLKIGGANATICKTQLDDCNFAKREKDLTITSLQEDVADLEEEQQKTKNQKWVFLIVGGALGALGYAFKEGKVGNKVKDKSSEEFNPKARG